MLEMILFYIFSAFVLGGAIGVISLKNPIHSALSLLLSLISIAALFLLMKATFVAVIHIAVYAGAIIIMFLFVIMLMGFKSKETKNIKPSFKIISFASVLFLILLLIKAFAIALSGIETAPSGSETSVKALSKLLFSTYLLPFELVSILILVAIIGAVYLGAKRSW